MKTIQEMIKVMKHFADGGEVECRIIRDWFSAPNPSWNWDSADYHIKQPVDPYAELKAAAADPTKQVKTKYCHEWRDAGRNWVWNLSASDYEIRDKPKPMKRVKLLAWFDGVSLLWRAEECPLLETLWKRIPSEDKVVEVEE